MQNTNNHEQKEELLKLVSAVVQQEAELRAKYQVGEKFRFIRDRLNALLSHLEENLKELQKKHEQKQDTITENELLVYVYIYNAQGVVLQTWQKMITPAAFYEHSVNRPIYTDKMHIEAFIRSKANKIQHAYLTIAIPKETVAKASAELLKDTLGHPLIKIKEGSLQFNRMIAFSHNGHEYTVGAAGALIKKKENP